MAALRVQDVSPQPVPIVSPTPSRPYLFELQRHWQQMHVDVPQMAQHRAVHDLQVLAHERQRAELSAEEHSALLKAQQQHRIDTEAAHVRQRTTTHVAADLTSWQA